MLEQESGLAVNVIVFWLGLSGAPTSGLVEILAALTSPSLSQFDSWWALRWNGFIWIGSNIHASWISVRRPHPITSSPSILLSPFAAISLVTVLTCPASSGGALPSDHVTLRLLQIPEWSCRSLGRKRAFTSSCVLIVLKRILSRGQSSCRWHKQKDFFFSIKPIIIKISTPLIESKEAVCFANCRTPLNYLSGWVSKEMCVLS